MRNVNFIAYCCQSFWCAWLGYWHQTASEKEWCHFAWETLCDQERM